MQPTRTSCPTCGSSVVVGGEEGDGMNYYVPANQRQHTEALLLLKRLDEWDVMRSMGDGPYWRAEIAKVMEING